MKSPTITREKTQIDVTDEVMGFTFKLGIALSAMIGVWAVSCLVAGLINAGPLQLVRGYITAITGL
jgi:hypothetical protein